MGQLYLSQSMGLALERAKKEAEQMKDEYISIEHLFLSIINEEGMALDALRRSQVFETDKDNQEISYNNVLNILKDVRGSTRITDPEPESQYQALKNYGRDLTQLAREENLILLLVEKKKLGG